MTSDAGFVLPHLPNEIWGKVFSYLPIEDHKSIRYSSHRFCRIFDSIDRKTIRQIVLYGNINTNAVIRSFSCCHIGRKVWHMELNMVHLLDDSTLSFFENQGTNIRCLILNNCKLKPGLLKRIIENCENLSKFALCATSSSGDPMSREELEAILDDFKALDGNRIIRRNVSDFTLKIDRQNWCTRDYHYFTNQSFLLFFSVFPNIRKLDLTFFVECFFFDTFTQDLSEITSGEDFTFSCIHYQLAKMRYQLEKLHLVFKQLPLVPCSSLFAWDQISDIEMSNLRDLSLSVTLKFEYLELYYILHMPYLTHFTIIFHRSLFLSPKSPVVEYILGTATHLRSLVIELSLIHI